MFILSELPVVSFCRRFTATAIAVLFLGGVAGAQGLGVTGNLVGLLGGARVLEVQYVAPGSLANQIGVFRGDTIVSINGMAPGNATTNQLAIARGGGRLEVVVIRNGRQLKLRINQFGGYGNPSYGSPGLRNPGFGLGYRVPVPGPFQPDRPRGNRFQLTPGDRGPNLQITLAASTGFGGVQVTRVTHGGIGDQLRFRVRDVITSVNNASINSTFQFRQAYIVSNQRQIVLRLLRNGRPRTITIDEQTLRSGAAAPGAVLTQLGLKTFPDRKRQVTVSSGLKEGLGTQLGIAKYGTRILEINGRPIRLPSDLKQIDADIAAGRVMRLEISVIYPDGSRGIVSYPKDRQSNQPRINARPRLDLPNVRIVPQY